MAPTRRRRTGGQADANTYLPFIPLLRLPTRPFGWSPHPQRAWNHSEVSVVVCAKSTVSTLFTLLLSGTYFGLITWRSNNMAKRRIGPRTNISRRVGGEVSSAKGRACQDAATSSWRLRSLPSTRAHNGTTGDQTKTGTWPKRRGSRRGVARPSNGTPSGAYGGRAGSGRSVLRSRTQSCTWAPGRLGAWPPHWRPHACN